MTESLNDALVAAVKCIGGSKVVGPKLFPEKTLESAQRLLLDCLNPDRSAHLTPEQAMLVMRMGREVGCHDVMNYLADSLGYAAPVPIDPRDELAELLRVTIESRKAEAARNERIERLLQQQAALRSVA